MALVLLCSEAELGDELQHTALSRESVEIRFSRGFDEARQAASELQPSVVLVDRDVSWAERLIRTLRQDLATRRLSVAVLARGDFDPGEVALLEVGANSILRLPPDPGWDDRLRRLIDVPLRRESRFPVYLEVETQSGVRSSTGTAVNLSVRGMLIESTFPLRVGDDLDLRFQLPESTRTVVGTAQVVRAAGRGRFGLEFYGLEGDGIELVRSFVGEASRS